MNVKMNFKSVLNMLGLLAVCMLFNTGIALAKAKPKLLVFSKTKGFHHSSIALGNIAIMKLGAENNFDVDTTTDASKFTLDNLKQYSAIVFLSTTGLSTQLFTEDQKTALMKYMEQGGGYVGIHAATDCCYDWQWYGDMSGAYFKGHPAQQQVATIDVVDPNTIATSFLPKEWKRKDEWYSFKWMAKDLHVILKIDESTYKLPGLEMGDHPMAWYHSYDGGRAFYTELGHVDESYSDPLYLQHILGGIQYAMGVKKINK